ncbi:hypothetical protein L1987_75191 [Smallanthus sonchifolius]|uniref:Uncharacterized protein n=1 Tax=Smallanthus sonchifolius TaxID=185202 RepID=A0ACB9A4R3_9ASTR|nr:hypothetical protein L1987_75191 [Smallanthus sonchifolius]
MPQWIFSITSLVSLDLSECGLHDLIPDSINSLHNLTSLKSLHISGNEFMSSSLALKGLSSIGGNLISLGMSSCGISSPALDSIHNLTSLLSLDLLGNQLTQKIPKSLGNLCNLRLINLGFNYFPNISSTSLLEGFLDCKSPSLELLLLESSELSSPLPDQLGRLINLVQLELSGNLHKRDQQKGDKSHGVDFGLIISILLGFFVGFWAIVIPLNVGKFQNWLGKLRYVKKQLNYRASVCIKSLTK